MGPFSGIPWPPRPGDYVHVNATGETARVVEVRDDFLLAVLKPPVLWVAY